MCAGKAQQADHGIDNLENQVWILVLAPFHTYSYNFGLIVFLRHAISIEVIYISVIAALESLIAKNVKQARKTHILNFFLSFLILTGACFCAD